MIINTMALWQKKKRRSDQRINGRIHEKNQKVDQRINGRLREKTAELIDGSAVDFAKKP